MNYKDLIIEKQKELINYLTVIVEWVDIDPNSYIGKKHPKTMKKLTAELSSLEEGMEKEEERDKDYCAICGRSFSASVDTKKPCQYCK